MGCVLIGSFFFAMLSSWIEIQDSNHVNPSAVPDGFPEKKDPAIHFWSLHHFLWRTSPISTQAALSVQGDDLSFLFHEETVQARGLTLYYDSQPSLESLFLPKAWSSDVTHFLGMTEEQQPLYVQAHQVAISWNSQNRSEWKIAMGEIAIEPIRILIARFPAIQTILLSHLTIELSINGIHYRVLIRQATYNPKTGILSCQEEVLCMCGEKPLWRSKELIWDWKDQNLRFPIDWISWNPDVPRPRRQKPGFLPASLNPFPDHWTRNSTPSS